MGLPVSLEEQPVEDNLLVSRRYITAPRRIPLPVEPPGRLKGDKAIMRLSLSGRTVLDSANTESLSHNPPTRQTAWL